MIGPLADRRPALFEIAETILLALVIFFGARLFVQTFSIDGRSMQASFEPGEYALVSKASYGLGSPQRGDVVVLYRPGKPTEELLKRVIGLPGEEIAIRDGQILINGRELDESQYLGDLETSNLASTAVPAGAYFVLGDNRSVSQDSRSFGPVPREAIVGKVVLVYWPIDQARTVPDPILELAA